MKTHIEVIRDEGDGPDRGKLMIIVRQDDAEPGPDGATPMTQILVPFDYDQSVRLCHELAEFIAEADRARELT